MRQAIITKFLAPTNTKGARIKAICERGSITIQRGYAGIEADHREAIGRLIAKFVAEDNAVNGTDPTLNPWSRPHSFGWLPHGGAVAVYHN